MNNFRAKFRDTLQNSADTVTPPVSDGPARSVHYFATLGTETQDKR